MNLVSRFFYSCDFDNNYSDFAIPSSLDIETNLNEEEFLESCAENYDKENIDENCLKVCENFELMNFSSFFYPKLRQFSHWSIEIKK